ncbi:hypothetical protein HS088_TW04G00252 [Tripterygium wilfordii]|uniref:Phosphorylated adapter RNA export protein n=1 Tax=Tripterygium wilfordii TaxID=458696 RepID=A0A7J7DPK4_TRIWF|nr:uncharacterized protein LOC119997622 [Tripterygium wilfordii]KAF5748300.1 hypothetical protein HS088_TW04G00252 [Tripterygium wilfordii]
MGEGESILEAIYEEDDLVDGEDVEMIDVEEGECVDKESHIGSGGTDVGQSIGGNVSSVNQGSESKNHRRKANKKKNKKKRRGPLSNVTDVNRFVLDTCRRLKEKKSYMVYNAVGCLGVSALSDIVNEVDAIQSCGGQMTADGRRLRTGGGILWNIIKAREPMAYKEIMKKAKEFEKQFRQQTIRKAPELRKDGSPEKTFCAVAEKTTVNVPDGSEQISRNQCEPYSVEEKHKSVHDRIRAPVSYDDLFAEDPKTD